IEKLAWDQAGRIDLIPEGHTLNEPRLLFEKIDDDVIQNQVNKLLNQRIDEEMGMPRPATKEAATFDDFQKLDLRTATILEAIKVPKSKKLLKLSVDTGVDKRTVVSGIAEHYDPEKLVGQKVCLVMNLAPRKIMGIESKG